MCLPLCNFHVWHIHLIKSSWWFLCWTNPVSNLRITVLCPSSLHISSSYLFSLLTCVYLGVYLVRNSERVNLWWRRQCGNDLTCKCGTLFSASAYISPTLCLYFAYDLGWNVFLLHQGHPSGFRWVRITEVRSCSSCSFFELWSAAYFLTKPEVRSSSLVYVLHIPGVSS